MQPSLEQYKEELARFGNRPVQWEMSMTQAVSLCGMMQVALRHPGLKSSPSAALAREFILEFITTIPEEFPHIKETLRRGFHSKFDQ